LNKGRIDPWHRLVARPEPTHKDAAPNLKRFSVFIDERERAIKIASIACQWPLTMLRYPFTTPSRRTEAACAAFNVDITPIFAATPPPMNKKMATPSPS
jgi:hypothetical protein